MAKISKNTLRIAEKPYAVKSPKGEWLVFANKDEALAVSKQMRWVYYLYLIDAKSWVPIGIIDR